MSACKKHLFFCKFETTLVYVVLGQPEQHSKTLSQKRKEKPIWKYQYCNISEIIFLYLFKVRVKIISFLFCHQFMSGGTMPQRICGGQRTTSWNWFSSPSFRRVPGIDLRFSGFRGKSFYLYSLLGSPKIRHFRCQFKNMRNGTTFSKIFCSTKAKCLRDPCSGAAVLWLWWDLRMPWGNLGKQQISRLRPQSFSLCGFNKHSLVILTWIPWTCLQEKLPQIFFFDHSELAEKQCNFGKVLFCFFSLGLL